MYAKRKLTDLSIKQAILKAKDSTKTVKYLMAEECIFRYNTTVQNIGE